MNVKVTTQTDIHIGHKTVRYKLPWEDISIISVHNFDFLPYRMRHVKIVWNRFMSHSRPTRGFWERRKFSLAGSGAELHRKQILVHFL